MRRVLLGLWLRSFRNKVVSGGRRLRQPRRLVGLAVGILYFVIVFGPRFAARHSLPQAMATLGGDAAFHLAGLGLLAGLAAIWLLPGFQLFRMHPAETTWLLQAPVSFRALGDALLLRDQGGVVLSAAVTSMVLRLGARAPLHRSLPAIWILLLLVQLHKTAAAATRLRLARRAGRTAAWGLPAAVALLAAGAAAAGVWWTWPQPPAGWAEGPEGAARAASTYLGTGALGWLARPGMLLLSTALGTGHGRLAGAATTLFVVGLHVVWIRAAAPAVFQEAAIEAAEARDRRERVKAAGRGRSRRKPPWPLSAVGRPETAFLWKGLAARGGLGAAPGLFLAAAPPLAALLWRTLARSEDWAVAVNAAIAFLLISGAGIVTMASGQIGFQLGPRQDLARPEVLKTLPLRGRRVLLGEVLGPLALIAVPVWSLLASALLLLPAGSGWPGPGIAAAGLVLPSHVLVSVLLMVSLGVYWPDWFLSTDLMTRGVEAMGLHILTAMVQFLALALLMLAVWVPAAVVGIAAIALYGPPGLLAGATVAVALYLGEAAGLLLAAGPVFERLDPTSEMAPS